MDRFVDRLMDSLTNDPMNGLSSLTNSLMDLHKSAVDWGAHWLLNGKFQWTFHYRSPIRSRSSGDHTAACS